jgi:hypothetical protein
VDVRSVDVGRVGVCILCTCVKEERGGEGSSGPDVPSLLSYTLRYVSLTDLDIVCQFGLIESRIREVKRRFINEDRCDERLKVKVEEST